MSLSLTLLTAAFLPALAWLVYIRYLDRDSPEPLHLVAFVFLLGMASTMPAALGNQLAQWIIEKKSGAVAGWLQIPEGARARELLQTFLLFFLGVGPLEELMKLLVVRLSIYYWKEFDEPIDALVYCAAAALGFASLENVLYAIEYGQNVLYLRALLSVPGHLLFSAIWGFGLARAKFGGKSFIPGLILAGFLHGLYNTLLVASTQLGYSRLGLLLVIPLFGVMGLMFVRRISALKRTSGREMERRRGRDGLLPVTLSTLPPIPAAVAAKPAEEARRPPAAAPRAPAAARPPAAAPARPAAAPAATPAAPPAAASAPAKGLVAVPEGGAWALCRRCGTALGAKARFCGSCGATAPGGGRPGEG